MLLYLVACFTEFVPDVHTHVLIGYAFLFFMIGNMGVHLYFLLRSSIKDCMRKYREKKSLHASLKDQKLKALSKEIAENESEHDQSSDQKSIKRRKMDSISENSEEDEAHNLQKTQRYTSMRGSMLTDKIFSRTQMGSIMNILDLESDKDNSRQELNIIELRPPPDLFYMQAANRPQMILSRNSLDY